ncbi:MAG: zeta toxin family protein [Planctomycetota bacterium]
MPDDAPTLSPTPDPPRIVVLAGPNGAGKTTAAPFILRDALAIDTFVNADTIAAGLAGFAPETVALEAGRLMLQRLHALADRRQSFAFETTLASRSYAPWLRRLKTDGYRISLIFLALPSPDTAIARVAQRVRQGGHHVPDRTVRRRFTAGIRNFFELYQKLADEWTVYDNADDMRCRVATGHGDTLDEIADSAAWEAFQYIGQQP